MGLNQNMRAQISKLMAEGNSELGVALDTAACTYLVARIAADLEVLSEFPEFGKNPIPEFYTDEALTSLRIEGLDFEALLDRFRQRKLGSDGDAETYFLCLAALHKARLKYERILRAQPVPTIEQVGPRGIIQFGTLSPPALSALLFWRKWIFDIDNRAAQETGYVFEPIIAHSVGGAKITGTKSPIKRHKDASKRRQVDCLIADKKLAYEIKLRVTIAASGQGRWREELDFPLDCKASGYKPILVVFDGTENPKLAELCAAFKKAGGEAYPGKAAWQHLDAMAGSTMATFIEKYVRVPIESLLKEAPQTLPDITFSMSSTELRITVGDGKLVIARQVDPTLGSDDPAQEVENDPISELGA